MGATDTREVLAIGRMDTESGSMRAGEPRCRTPALRATGLCSRTYIGKTVRTADRVSRRAGLQQGARRGPRPHWSLFGEDRAQHIDFPCAGEHDRGGAAEMARPRFRVTIGHAT